MTFLDWAVLFGTIGFIAIYGMVRTRGSANLDAYLKGDNKMKWWMIGVSIMATQASAVTFISTPGQAIVDGMRFIQFYFGLPLAMIIISVTFVPIYYKLKVYTAYEYLEGRFDAKTRILACILFMALRGLSAGITLFAPALVLSTLLGWKVAHTTMLIGLLVIVYVVSGGTKAVSLTQRQQLSIVMGGMVLAGILAFAALPDTVTFGDTINLAGSMGRLNMVNLKFDLNDRYNIWSGLIAGTFLFLSYFGTDQSQVARYLGGRSVTESRLGLMFNGLLKVPMQFIILFIGVMVFVFFLFNAAPVFHNQVLYERALETPQKEALTTLSGQYDELTAEKKSTALDLVNAMHAGDNEKRDALENKLRSLQENEVKLRDEVKEHIATAIPNAKTQDRDYIFLNFVLHHLPHGIVGLLLAVMFSAAMSSMAGELNALAATSAVDIYKRLIRKEADQAHFVLASRVSTLLWAVFAMAFAMLASFSENLIQFVNIVGSLFYGTILGIFLTAFYVKSVRGTSVFWAAIIAETVVIYCYFFTHIAYLLYNIIGCVVVVGLALLLELGSHFRSKPAA